MENNQTAFIIFKTEVEKISVDVRFEEETVWLSPLPRLRRFVTCA